jgi:hypothetical protein
LHPNEIVDPSIPVEQAALKATQDFQANDVPKDLSRGGFTEFRFGMVIEETIEMLEEMRNEVENLGWRNFYENMLWIDWSCTGRSEIRSFGGCAFTTLSATLLCL